MEYKVTKIKLSLNEVLQKMRNWCAYQERSQQEVRQKLHEMSASSLDTEEIIATLISENYMNEARFTKAFVGGRFRIKHWGKNKIRVELRKHKVPETMIMLALKEIDQDDYLDILRKTIEKRKQVTHKTEQKKQFFDLLRYCISRGFESDLVTEELNTIIYEK
jgi:regulatory protein